MSIRPDKTTASFSADEAAVRGLYQQLMDGWNQGSGAAFAAVFAEDGDLVAFDGTHFKGRQEIAPFHQQLFDKWLKGSRLVGQVKDVRFLSPDVVVMHAVGGTVMRGKTEPSPERDSIQTLIATRQGGEWRLAAFQNTRVRPIGRNAIAFLIWTLSDWLWKVFRLNKRATMSNTITTQTTKRKAAITGCGIAGPVLAVFLRRAGIDSVIYEGRPESGDEAGAFLGLAPNGRNVLATLGIRNEINALGVPTTKIAFLNHEGKRLGGNPQPTLDFRIAGLVRGQLAPPSASPPRMGGLSGVAEFESWPCI